MSMISMHSRKLAIAYSSLATFSLNHISLAPLTTKISPLNKPSFYSPRTLASTMAGESESFTEATAVSDDVKFGFERSEMYQSNLAGTVEPPFDRHVFLTYQSHETWPSRVEDSDSDLLPKLLSAAIKARKNDIKIKTRLTVCEGGEDVNLSDGDVLIFPDMVKYSGLKESEVDGFVEDVLVSGKPWTSGEQGSLDGAYVFVCAHNNRDRRCGVCGPPLIEKFKEEIEAKGLKDQVFVAACSHIGGHKYAGNVIIFSEVEGKVAGHWYGYVTPNDVPTLLDQHIGEGKVIERIWRGQMGLHTEKAADKTDEQKVPNGTNVDNKENKPQETRTEESKGSFMSCCQGANGVSCCRDASAEEVESKKAQGGLLKFGKWEQHEILTAVGVVAAVSVVAVAYGFYKRAR
nr:altered inheritance of mitochondria protein 32-like [Ipomoea trifida]